MKILTVCAHGINRSVFLREYLRSRGYDVQSVGVDDVHLGAMVRRSDLIISVHPEVLNRLEEIVDLSGKRVISLDVEDRPERSLPDGKRLDGEDWVDFQDRHVYPKLVEQIDVHLPFDT